MAVRGLISNRWEIAQTGMGSDMEKVGGCSVGGAGFQGFSNRNEVGGEFLFDRRWARIALMELSESVWD